MQAVLLVNLMTYFRLRDFLSREWAVEKQAMDGMKRAELICRYPESSANAASQLLWGFACLGPVDPVNVNAVRDRKRGFSMTLRSVVRPTRLFTHLLVLSAAAWLGHAVSARADVLLDTYASGANGGGWALLNASPTSQALAVPFSVSSPMTIDEIQANIFMNTGSVLAGIQTDASGLPSNIWVGSKTFDTPSGIDAFPADLTLTAGNYWLVAEPIGSDSNGGWYTANATGELGYAQAAGTTDWSAPAWQSGTLSMPEAMITGSAATPEPGTLLLVGSGLAAAVSALRRRRAAR